MAPTMAGPPARQRERTPLPSRMACRIKEVCPRYKDVAVFIHHIKQFINWWEHATSVGPRNGELAAIDYLRCGSTEFLARLCQIGDVGRAASSAKARPARRKSCDVLEKLLPGPFSHVSPIGKDGD